MPSWVSLIILLLCFSLNGVSDAHGHRKHLHAPAVLVGTVYCDTCFHQKVSKSSHFISGATVSVECGSHHGKQSFRQEVKTNKNGEFEAKLPLSVSKNLDKIKACSVKLLTSTSPYCSVAASATSSQIHYKLKTAGKHIFSAGFFTFKPELCDQKDSIGKDFPPALPDPASPFLPPVGGGGGIIPTLPVPDLPIPPVIPPLVPPLPRLPGVPLPPLSRQKNLKNDHLSDQKQFGFPFPPVIPPLPLVPSPPSLIPPVIPTPPPSLLPPILPTPPPASFFPPLPFPPVPGLIPSPPPPPPPAFPIPLPPVPFLPPVPGFPGVPPASKKTIP